jgi:hypothetical protein
MHLYVVARYGYAYASCRAYALPWACNRCRTECSTYTSSIRYCVITLHLRCANMPYFMTLHMCMAEYTIFYTLSWVLPGDLMEGV